jgi:hypothetical protein
MTRRCRRSQPVALAPSVVRREARGGEAGEHVGGVALELVAGAVVAAGGARVGVPGGVLDVAQAHAGVQGERDERVAQRVRADGMLDAGAPGEPADDLPGGLAVEPPAGAGGQQRPGGRSPTASPIAA